MQSAKKMKALSVLSMAAAATLGANAAQGAALTLYYDNITELAPNSSIVQSFNYANVGGNYSAIPTAINITVGDTFEFGIDAVLSGNANPNAGTYIGGVLQPSYLGLSTLGIVVPSSDTNASKLAPNTLGPPFMIFGGAPDYNSTTSLNNQGGLGSSVGPNNNHGGFVPSWFGTTQGDVSPTSATAGDVGDHFAIFQGNGPVAPNTVAGVNTLAQYGAATASFGNATDFFDSLSYTALAPGTVTLSPAVVDTQSGYWLSTLSLSVNSSGLSDWSGALPASGTVEPEYESTTFTNPGDVINGLPELVINISPVPEPTSVGLLAVGGLGLLSGRHRRQK
jgi:hypothetical protein